MDMSQEDKFVHFLKNILFLVRTSKFGSFHNELFWAFVALRFRIKLRFMISEVKSDLRFEICCPNNISCHLCYTYSGICSFITED